MVLVRSMNNGRPKPDSQVRLLRAKAAAGSAARAAADSALNEMQRAASAFIGDYFLAPSATCHLARRAGAAEDLKAAASKAACLWLTGTAERPVIVGFDERLIIAAADIAMARALSAGAGAPTAIDRAVAAAFARRIASLIEPRTDDSAGRPLQSGPVGDLLAQMSVSHWMLYSIAIDLGAAGEAMAAIVAVPAEPRVDDGVPASADALRRRFSALPVNARCIAGGFEAPLSRLLRLAPGEVFAIEWRGDGAAPLIVGNQEIAIGSLGEHSGRRAIRLGGTS